MTTRIRFPGTSWDGEIVGGGSWGLRIYFAGRGTVEYTHGQLSELGAVRYQREVSA